MALAYAYGLLTGTLGLWLGYRLGCWRGRRGAQDDLFRRITPPE